MSKTKFYRQCKLVKKHTNSTSEQTSYIPSELCEVGGMLRLKEGDIWSEGWEIVQMGDLVPASHVEERERDWTRQRKASDI